MEKIKIEEATKEFMGKLREVHPDVMSQYDMGFLSKVDALRELGYEIAGVTDDYRSGISAGDRVRIKEEAFSGYQKEWNDLGYELPADLTGTVVFTRLGVCSIEWDGIPYIKPDETQRLMFFPNDLEIVEVTPAHLAKMIKKITVTVSAITKYEVEVWKMDDGGIRFVSDKIIREEIKKEWQTAYFKNPGEASCAIAEFLI